MQNIYESLFFYVFSLLWPSVVGFGSHRQFLLLETTAPISFKFGVQLPYIGDHRNASLHVDPIVHVSTATLLGVVKSLFSPYFQHRETLAGPTVLQLWFAICQQLLPQ